MQNQIIGTGNQSIFYEQKKLFQIKFRHKAATNEQMKFILYILNLINKFYGKQSKKIIFQFLFSPINYVLAVNSVAE